VFNEDDFGSANPATRPQAIIQSQLRGLGGVLADCTVEALSPQEYVVYFGDASGGEVYPLITLVDQSFSGGFFPSVDVSMVRQPTTVADINVASTNNTTSLTAEEAALATATQIENAFARQTETTYATAPIDVQAPDEYDVVGSLPGPLRDADHHGGSHRWSPWCRSTRPRARRMAGPTARCSTLRSRATMRRRTSNCSKIVAVTDDAGADLTSQFDRRSGDDAQGVER